MFFRVILLFSLLQLGKIAQSVNNKKSEHCYNLLQEYGNSLQHFLGCSLHHAVPVSMCFVCVNDYRNLTAQYDVFIKAEDKGVKCREQFIDNDRLNIVLRNHDYFTNLWNEASCDECFNENTTISSNETVIMNNKLGALTKCLSNKAVTNPCEGCSFFYNDANSYYNEEFVKKHKKNICFDIRDNMNRTRSLWSKTLKCCKRDANFGPFAATATCISCLPIIFYLFVYFYTKRRENNHAILNNEELSSSESSINTAVPNNDQGIIDDPPLLNIEVEGNRRLSDSIKDDVTKNEKYNKELIDDAFGPSTSKILSKEEKNIKKENFEDQEKKKRKTKKEQENENNKNKKSEPSEKSLINLNI